MMKNIIKIIGFYFLLICFSCQEVIELKLQTKQKALVIDAAIDWNKQTKGNHQQIKLSYTTDYYTENQQEGVANAQIKVTDGKGNVFDFPEVQKGMYECQNFIPKINEKYTLQVNYLDKEYTSTSIMLEVPTITGKNIIQRENGGIFKNQKELQLTFDANASEKNHFVLKVEVSNKKEKGIYTLNDRYLKNGKFFFNITGVNKKLEKDDIVIISLYRVTEDYRKILDLFLNFSLNGGHSVGAPLYSIPSRVVGNIINLANQKDNPLGAFRVSQFSQITYKVK